VTASGSLECSRAFAAPAMWVGDVGRCEADNGAVVDTLTHRMMAMAGASGQELRPTITAALNDGPLRGRRLDVQVVEGRPPSTVDVSPDDRSTYRYCLADWVQSGPSAVYTFLYEV
jgi:hypothetical protein